MTFSYSNISVAKNFPVCQHCLLVRKDEVKQKVQSLTAAAAATSKTSCAAQAQPTAFKPTAVRARCAALQS